MNDLANVGYGLESPHNPEVVGSNPAPATTKTFPDLVKRVRDFFDHHATTIVTTILPPKTFVRIEIFG